MKIHQIIPAERGWHLNDWDPEGKSGGLREIICWALVDDPEDPSGQLIAPVVACDAPVGLPVVELKTHSYLRSPVESFRYQITTGAEPADSDWEAVSMSESNETLSVLWRSPAR